MAMLYFPGTLLSLTLLCGPPTFLIIALITNINFILLKYANILSSFIHSDKIVQSVDMPLVTIIVVTYITMYGHT